MTVFLPIIALILPLIALVIEQVFSYPYVVEELLKASLVFLLPEEADSKSKIGVGFAIGICFAITETFLYSTSLFLSGGIEVFVQRLIFTSILHSITCVVMSVSILSTKKGLIIGMLTGILVHFMYNNYIN